MRYLVAAMSAALVTGLIFLLMQTLVDVDGETVNKPESGPAIDVVRVDREERVETIDRTLPEPPEQPQVPETIDVSHATESPVDKVEFPELPDTLISEGIPIPGGPLSREGQGEQNLSPVVRIEPQWPRRAVLDGIEGWVKIQFTVGPDGSVEQPRVIESHPPRLFDQQAMRAIQRWRFRPRMVDGRPVEQTATQVIEFRLEDR
ncbi:energy transducer TonB [Gammaproteobacteria bacterium AB-CW1]|uniref:Protein TonB n=1 Tax=Natronospira elongata TaxID=3110268 RepID=A0AAP6MNI1_9GAMM|nr:energy transducer TonB [Gammaproteobacteria bacterium AB-CW1]